MSRSVHLILSCSCIEFPYEEGGQLPAVDGRRKSAQPQPALAQIASAKSNTIVVCSITMLSAILTLTSVTAVQLGRPNLTVTPLFDTCSAPGESCADTNCCNRPGWACVRHRKNKEHKMCHRHAGATCEDTAEWECPRDDMCTEAFQDCRTSLCCRPAPYFRGHRDVEFDCLRRPHVYYAQCRPRMPTAEGSPAPPCVDSGEWLCPNWSDCVAPYEECSASRCCAEKGFSCYLNATALEEGDGWHAYCRPTLVEDGGKADAPDTATSRWLSPHEWMEHAT